MRAERVGVVDAAAARRPVEAVRFDALERRGVGPVVLVGEAMIEIPLAAQALARVQVVVDAVEVVGEPVVVRLAAIVVVVGAVRLHQARGIVRQRVELVVEPGDGVVEQRSRQDVVGERRARDVPAHERGRAGIVNDVLRGIGGAVEQRRKIAVALGGGGNSVDGRGTGRGDAGQLAVGDVKEEPVLAVQDLGNVDRAADAEAGLADAAGGLLGRAGGDRAVGQPRLIGQAREVRCGVPAELLELPEPGAVQGIGAALGRGGDLRADGMAQGGVIGRGLDAHLVDGFRVGDVARAPAVGAGDRVAVEQEFIGAAAQAARGIVGGRGMVERAIVIRLQAAGEDHARGHRLHQERVHRAVGKLRHVARIEHAALRGARGFEQRGVGGHFDRLRRLAERELEVDGQAAADLEGDGVADGLLEALGVDGHRVSAGIEVIDLVIAGLIGGGAADRIGRGVGHGHGGARDDRILRIRHLAGNTAARFLRLRNGGAEQGERAHGARCKMPTKHCETPSHPHARDRARAAANLDGINYYAARPHAERTSTVKPAVSQCKTVGARQIASS